jgi:hypothetical protein
LFENFPHIVGSRNVFATFPVPNTVFCSKILRSSKEPHFPVLQRTLFFNLHLDLQSYLVLPGSRNKYLKPPPPSIGFAGGREERVGADTSGAVHRAAKKKIAIDRN